MKRVWIFIFSLLFISQYSLGDNLKLQVYAKSKAAVGEIFPVEFSVDANASNFTPPNFENLRIMSGPHTQSQTSVSVVNGKLTHLVTTKISYMVSAIDVGKAKIGSASVMTDGKKLSSAPLTLQIIKGSPQPSSSGNGIGSNSPNSSTQNISNDDLFVKASVDKKSAFLGEQVIISYKIYSRVRISDLQIGSNPSFAGFWTQNLTQQRYLEKSEATINGNQYAVGLLLEKAIFPQKTGEITIPPIDVNVIAQIKSQQKKKRNSNSPFDSFFNDPFFGNNYIDVPKTLRSNSIKLNVNELPSGNKPLSFQGAVGKFNLTATIDTNKLETNEAITINVKLTGEGNIDLVNNLSYNFPPDFDVFDPKVTNDVKTGPKGVYGSKTFEYLIIPRSPGQFVLEPIVFTYFDVDKKQYVNLETPKWVLNVKKGRKTDSGNYYSGKQSTEIQYLGKDIRHIKVMPYSLYYKSEPFIGSLYFYIALLLPVIILILIIKLTFHLRLVKGDIVLMKHKKATKVAKQHLVTAEKHMLNKVEESFYTEVSNALWGYVTDKFNLLGSELFIDRIEKVLNNKNVTEENIKQFISVLKECEFARFAPGNANSKMEEIYKQAIDTITKIESELK